MLSTNRWFAYDVVSQVTFGEPIGFIKSQRDVRNIIRGFTEDYWLLEILARVPKVSWWLRNTHVGRKFFMAKPTDTAGVGVVLAVIVLESGVFIYLLIVFMLCTGER